MAIKRFEDIRAWQKARKLVKMIYLLTDEGKFAKDFGLRDQIRRAAVSVMANIAEGFDCDSQVEFARFQARAYQKEGIQAIDLVAHGT